MEATVYWSPGMTLEVLEQCVIVKAMKHYRSNKTAVASSLGISIRTLDSRLEKYMLDEIDREADNTARREQQQEHLRRSRGLHPTSLAQTDSIMQVGTQNQGGILAQSSVGITAPVAVAVAKKV